MNLEPAPRLSKTTFFLIDAGLLLTAAIIALNAKDPYAPLPFVSAVVCVVLAAVIVLVPYIIDYAADSAEYVQQERLRINEQIQRLQAAGENLARAAAQIKAVEEAVHKAAHSAENLPYRMQEKLAEFNEALAEKESADHEALEQELTELRAANSDQLKAVADKIAKTTAELAALELSTRRQLSAAEASAAKVQQAAAEAASKLEAQIAHALTTLDGHRTALAPAPIAAAAPAPTPAEPSVSLPANEPTEALPVNEPDNTSPEEPQPKKLRAPRKAKTEEPLLAPSEPELALPTEEPIAPEVATTPKPTTFDEEEPTASNNDERPEAAASSDGATRLLATAYIGIGNKLFVRGDGPGLSWDKGVPMQFVSIGKWGWATHDATGPVRCALYKNDETAAMTGEVTLEPGKHVEITALF